MKRSPARSKLAAWGLTAAAAAGLALPLTTGCAKTVLVNVPPRMDLSVYPRVGIVRFSSNAGDELREYATQQFQEYVQSGQPGVRFVEIPGADIGGDNAPDADALKKLSDRYHVAAVFWGDVSYTSVEPSVSVNDVLKMDASLKATMDGTITVRLLETDSGASAWTRSATFHHTMGQIHGAADQPVSIGLKTTPDPRRGMVPELVAAVTGDFAPTAVRQRAP